VTSLLGVIGLTWASCTKKYPTSLERSRLGEIEFAWARSSRTSGLGEFGRAWVNVDAFQLSLVGFIYFPSAQSSPFFPRIMKLTQNLE